MKKTITATLLLSVFTLGFANDDNRTGVNGKKPVPVKQFKKVTTSKKNNYQFNSIEDAVIHANTKEINRIRKKETKIGNDVAIYTYFKEVNAEFINGDEAFLASFKRNLSELSLKKGENKTYVSFVVDSSGNVSNVNAEGKNAAFNTETILAIYRTSGQWIPAQIKGKYVSTIYRVPIIVNYVDKT